MLKNFIAILQIVVRVEDVDKCVPIILRRSTKLFDVLKALFGVHK